MMPRRFNIISLYVNNIDMFIKLIHKYRGGAHIFCPGGKRLAGKQPTAQFIAHQIREDQIQFK